jgi:coproporphyrinogen dehydrogenase HemZ
MSDPKGLWVKIDGIEMEHEAWLLIRLFFKDEYFRFYSENEYISGSLLYIRVKNEGIWECRAEYYSNIEGLDVLQDISHGLLKPDLSSSKTVSESEIRESGGSILKSRKILVGAVIYDVLSKAAGKQLPYGALTGVRPVKLAMSCLKDGLDKEGTIRMLVRATGMSREKAGLLYDVAEAEMPYIETDPKSVHLYIGIPFCTSRCLYCSFVSYATAGLRSIIPGYIDALEKEIRFAGEMVKTNALAVRSAYIGGGTPTALDEYSLNKVLELVNQTFDLRNTEFTVEAGRPDTITEEKLKILKNNYITRISINPQTMNNETLRTIGRNHTSEDITVKYMMAREMGFGNINMDIIAGLPGEDETMFAYTLEKIEEMAPDSLTVHTMAVKRASRLHENAGMFRLAPDNVTEAMTEMAGRSARIMGMRPYYLYRQKNILANLENTGYAKPGYECIYNINTMEEYQTIIAMGAGAISKFISQDGKKIERACNVKEVAQYISRIDEMLERKKAFILR